MRGRSSFISLVAATPIPAAMTLAVMSIKRLSVGSGVHISWSGREGS